MMLLDVNVLLYAFRDEMPLHAKAAQLITGLAKSQTPFGSPEICLSSLLRIVTQKPFSPTSTVTSVLKFCDALHSLPNFHAMRPSDRHWPIFRDMCLCVQPEGKLVADAYLATFAIERDDEWITNDRDFMQFPGLRWRNPFTGQARTNPR